MEVKRVDSHANSINDQIERLDNHPSICCTVCKQQFAVTDQVVFCTNEHTRHIYHAQCFHKELNKRRQNNPSHQEIDKDGGTELLCFECEQRMNVFANEKMGPEIEAVDVEQDSLE